MLVSLLDFIDRRAQIQRMVMVDPSVSFPQPISVHHQQNIRTDWAKSTVSRKLSFSRRCLDPILWQRAHGKIVRNVNVFSNCRIFFNFPHWPIAFQFYFRKAKELYKCENIKMHLRQRNWAKQKPTNKQTNLTPCGLESRSWSPY